MIDDRDLDAAVTAGVLDAATRDRLVAFARDHRRGEAGPDEEQFRLLTGFNDIFVSIAVVLVLVAVATLGGSIAPILGAIGVAATSWALAEYFTRIRRMALPSIVLLLAFVGGVLATVMAIFGPVDAVFNRNAQYFGAGGGLAPVIAAAAAAGAAFLHWRRFMVPITVAAGAGALTLMVVSAVTVTAGSAATLLTLLACGLAVFALAMWFDTRDRARVTRRTDVAFWLHLLAAPLIVHPMFSLTGINRPDAGAAAAAVAILCYLALTLVALAIDRRALLVSALVYMVFAVGKLIEGGGLVAGFGLTALVIGLFLVLLSAAWRTIRARVLALLPAGLASRLPVPAV